jgi:hypothetical protein
VPRFEDPVADAAEAQQALRGLAHATRTVGDPAAAYQVLGSLAWGPLSLPISPSAGWGGASSRMLAPPRSRIFTSVFSQAGGVSQVGSRVELFEAIRRDRRMEALSIRELAEDQFLKGQPSILASKMTAPKTLAPFTTAEGASVRGLLNGGYSAYARLRTGGSSDSETNRVRLGHASLDAKESSMSKTGTRSITPPVNAEATTAAAAATGGTF